MKAEMSALPRPAKTPCKSCPYRRDVPAGVWDASEYEKLPGYDGETFEQIEGGMALFFCHQQDGHLCAGWVGCHDPQELLALRLHPVDPSTFSYRSPLPLFASGTEAAAHGMSGIEEPDSRARAVIARLTRKMERRSAAAQDEDGTQHG